MDKDKTKVVKVVKFDCKKFVSDCEVEEINASRIEKNELLLKEIYESHILFANNPIKKRTKGVIKKLSIEEMEQLGFFVIEYKGGYAIIEYEGNDTDIVIPEGVIAIGGGAFENRGINSVVLPDSLVKIGENAFAHNPIKEYTLKGKVYNVVQEGGEI